MGTVGDFFNNISNYGDYNFNLVDEVTGELLLEDPDYRIPEEFYNYEITYIEFRYNKTIDISVRA